MEIDIICNKCKGFIITIESNYYDLHKNDYCKDYKGSCGYKLTPEERVELIKKVESERTRKR